MKRNDSERDFRLLPARPKARNERATWATGFKLLVHYARSSRVRRSGTKGGGRTARTHRQRCAVRVVYSKNTTPGQWRAHGRYVARESATFEDKAKAAGFNAGKESVDVSAELDRWQAARDPLLWKMILSPEFGDRADLPKLTRDLMQKMQQDLGTDFEWVAVAHYNTEHPHVHVTVRGIKRDGQALRFERAYIKQGIRAIAEELCTRQFGYRTGLDAAEAERREIAEHRFTSLDRVILREGVGVEPASFMVTANPAERGISPFARTRAQHIAGRLAVLDSMGLASSVAPNTWQVQRDFETVLRAMQRTNDHQKTLAAHGVLASDERLPIRVLSWDERTGPVEGRILVHGQEEFSGRSYLMLEGTDAAIHFVYYTPELERARGEGRLRTNSFVKLRRLFGVGGKTLLDIHDLGNAEALLRNHRHFEGAGQGFAQDGLIPAEDGWGGWLGKYQAELRKATVRVMQEEHHERKIERHQSLGR